jgi:hypothetical protein
MIRAKRFARRQRQESTLAVARHLADHIAEEIHEQVMDGGLPSTLSDGGHAQGTHAPGPDLHREQYVHAPQRKGIDVQEITRQDADYLTAETLPPGWRRTVPSWLEPGRARIGRTVLTRYPRLSSLP